MPERSRSTSIADGYWTFALRDSFRPKATSIPSVAVKLAPLDVYDELMGRTRLALEFQDRRDTLEKGATFFRRIKSCDNLVQAAQLHCLQIIGMGQTLVVASPWLQAPFDDAA